MSKEKDYTIHILIGFVLIATLLVFLFAKGLDSLNNGSDADEDPPICQGTC